MEDNIEFTEELDSDVEALGADAVSEAVVYASDWTTETLLSQLDRDNISINPRFQRRDAWTVTRKSRLIESLVLGLPVPQIVLAERRGERGRYLVLDGKQRLLALQQFTGRGEGPNNLFPLTGLEVRRDLNGQTNDDLETDPERVSDRSAFENQTIRTVVIRNWPDIDFLHLVFVRLNTGSVPLSPQELRQALFPGPFVDFADDHSVRSPGLRYLLSRDQPDFRMRDVELLIRHIGFRFFIGEYRGNLKRFLDSTCERLNTTWEDVEQQVEEAFADFETAVAAGSEVFGAREFGRKWNENGAEPRLNRAVLDVQLHFLVDQKLRERSLDARADVLAAFQALCIEDEEFRASIEATTKSLGATGSRFSRWGEKLAEVLELDFPIPRLIEGEIVVGPNGS